ncbi:hypothetical protein [Sphingobium yanoikuyae]
MTLAYLQLALKHDSDAWASACMAVTADSEAARIEQKDPVNAKN